MDPIFWVTLERVPKLSIKDLITMTILYTLPDCGKCDAAKEKLDRFDILHEEKPYKHHTTYHNGWRNDGSLDVVTARCFFGETAVPLILHDGKFYDYPGFMKQVKNSLQS
jgi:glutaredoxin